MTSPHHNQHSHQDQGHQDPGHHEHDHQDHHHAHMLEFRKRFWIVLILTIPVMLLSPMIQHWLGIRELLAFQAEEIIVMTLSTIIFFYGGWPFLTGMLDELKARNPGMMTLVGVAILVAFVYSTAVVLGFPGEYLFWELSTLILVFLLGHWIEMRSVLGASRALEELAQMMPATAHRISADDQLEEIPTHQLRPHDRILVRPAEKVPADGIVISGHSALNESMLTGESVPVDKSTGDEVIGGSINGEGALTIEVQRTGQESFLAQVIELVRQAQESKSRTQDLANRAARWLTFIALGGGLVTFLIWILFTDTTLDYAVERAVTVMIITCPHALGLAIPLVVAVSTSLAAARGLLIRDRKAFEQARNIQAVLFDKTGTLTHGQFGVTNILSFDKSLAEDELLALAASLESHSQHPIARGIAAASQPHRPVENFSSMTGAGVQGTVDGHALKIVSPGYLRRNQISFDDERLQSITGPGQTIVFVLINDTPAGAIAVADVIREESKDAIARLHAIGIQTMMLTGDNKQVAGWVAQEIGLDEYFAEVLPEQKALKIKEVQSRNLVVAMTGDGVNDAPALAQADVGIAIGAGTDVAIETADIILVRSNPEEVVAIIELARATYRKMLQNLAWATGYNVIAIPLAAGIAAPFGLVLAPAVGALLMSASTIIVAINSRLLRVPSQKLFGPPTQ